MCIIMALVVRPFIALLLQQSVLKMVCDFGEKSVKVHFIGMMHKVPIFLLSDLSLCVSLTQVKWQMALLSVHYYARVITQIKKRADF
jgi:hypothetical protein